MMRVILAMARQAIHRQRCLGDVLCEMAGMAIEVAMGPGQRVVGQCVVIITPAFPAIRVVTNPAVRPQAAFMMPVAVAGVAI
jgi:hypothetical protein